MPKKQKFIAILLAAAGLLSACNSGRDQENAELWRSPTSEESALEEMRQIQSSLVSDATPDAGKLKRQAILSLFLEHPDAAQIASGNYAALARESPNNRLLAEAFQHRNPVVRANAARVVGQVGLTGAARALRKATSDPEEIVRRCSIRALGQLRDEKSRFRLLLALKDGSWRVRAEAAEALENLGDPGTVKYLLRRAQERDGFASMAIERAVLELASPECQRALSRALRAPLPEARRLAALALARIGDAGGGDALIMLIREGSTWREAEVVDAVAALYPDTAPELFRSLLEGMPAPDAAARMRAWLTGEVAGP